MITILENDYQCFTLEDLENLVFNEENKKRIYAKERGFSMTLLLKDNQGISNFFKLISLINTDFFTFSPKILRSELNKYRHHLLLGSGCINSEVFNTALNNDDEELKKVISYYDYIELQPLSGYH